MKSVWIRRSGAKRIVVLFGGWGFDERCLNPDAFKNADLLFFYDYRTLDLPALPDFGSYERVYLAAWSFGVWVANLFFDRFPKRKISVAINGSWDPVSDARGIPEKIFRATLQTYDEQAKEKFLARIFGSYPLFGELKKYAPEAPAREQRQELAALAEHFKKYPQTPRDWTRAIASPSDKIFPIKSMLCAWGEKLEKSGSAHYPEEMFLLDFFKNADEIFRLRDSFKKSSSSYVKNAVVQEQTAEKLAGLALEYAGSAAKDILELGCGTGFLTRLMLDKFPSAKISAIDICENLGECLSDKPQRVSFILSDARSAEFPKGVDMVASASFLQWIPDRAPLFFKCERALKSGGILALSTFGPKNLSEIRELCGSGLEYPALEELSSEIRKAGLELLFSKDETRMLEFASVSDVLRHLKLTGVNGAHRRFWTPGTFEKFKMEYEGKFPLDNGVSLTYNPIYIIAKKG